MVKTPFKETRAIKKPQGGDKQNLSYKDLITRFYALIGFCLLSILNAYRNLLYTCLGNLLLSMKIRITQFSRRNYSLRHTKESTKITNEWIIAKLLLTIFININTIAYYLNINLTDLLILNSEYQLKINLTYLSVLIITVRIEKNKFAEILNAI